jgi:hypothetical protein
LLFGNGACVRKRIARCVDSIFSIQRNGAEALWRRRGSPERAWFNDDTAVFPC